jgi:hypothetical protein
MPKPPPTVAIIHGFAEGPAISKLFRQTLTESGFKLVDDPKEAQIIVAHSGGLFLLPENLHDKIILLSAPSIGYLGNSLLRPGLQKIWYDFRFAGREGAMGKWFIKSFFNSVYIISNPRKVRTMWRGVKTSGAALPAHQARSVLVIGHKGDPWSGHISAHEIAKHTTYGFMSHTGIHDDLWSNPQEYISVIQYLYES